MAQVYQQAVSATVPRKRTVTRKQIKALPESHPPDHQGLDADSSFLDFADPGPMDQPNSTAKPNSVCSDPSTAPSATDIPATRGSNNGDVLSTPTSPPQAEKVTSYKPFEKPQRRPMKDTEIPGLATAVSFKRTRSHSQTDGTESDCEAALPKARKKQAKHSTEPRKSATLVSVVEGATKSRLTLPPSKPRAGLFSHSKLSSSSSNRPGVPDLQFAKIDNAIARGIAKSAGPKSIADAELPMGTVDALQADDVAAPCRLFHGQKYGSCHASPDTLPVPVVAPTPLERDVVSHVSMSLPASISEHSNPDADASVLTDVSDKEVNKSRVLLPPFSPKESVKAILQAVQQCVGENFVLPSSQATESVRSSQVSQLEKTQNVNHVLPTYESRDHEYDLHDVTGLAVPATDIPEAFPSGESGPCPVNPSVQAEHEESYSDLFCEELYRSIYSSPIVCSDQHYYMANNLSYSEQLPYYPILGNPSSFSIDTAVDYANDVPLYDAPERISTPMELDAFTGSGYLYPSNAILSYGASDASLTQNDSLVRGNSLYGVDESAHDTTMSQAFYSDYDEALLLGYYDNQLRHQQQQQYVDGTTDFEPPRLRCHRLC
ncbi:uncharacterized protein V1518DRAFT_418171 [Limtongia smithiae]|uniref:uncharacterized protein n=1 Tax=Limtongia smithiae TaxID=1125753 RepID=UPI0034CD95A2